MKRREFLNRIVGTALMSHTLPGALEAAMPEPPRDDANPFLSGNFAPVAEERDLVDLPVQGRLPAGLAGAYLRNGPNPAFPPIAYTYPLDGDGMIHAVYLENGRARYRNRWVVTRGLRAERRTGRALYGSIQHPVPVDPQDVGADGDPGPFKNVANTNVIRYAGRVLALYEGGLPYALSEELETLGEWDFGGKLTRSMAAHPRFDPATRELHFFRYLGEHPYLTYFVGDRGGRIVRSVPIELPEPVMVHDFVLTERHVVFVDCPAVLTERGIVWKAERETRIGVLPRQGRSPAIRWFSTPPFFVYHFVNGFSDERRVTVDYVRHAAFGAGPPTGDAPGRRRPPSLSRLTVDLARGTVKDEPLDDRPVEFPRMDERRTGRPYRFGYVPTRANAGAPGIFDGLVQYDLERKSATVRTYGEGRSTGEAIFVARPGAAGERDGWVLSFVYDAGRDASDLMILDAADFAGEPVATVRLPVRVPEGLHGNWLPAVPGTSRRP